jgi:hypothetical protein
MCDGGCVTPLMKAVLIVNVSLVVLSLKCNGKACKVVWTMYQNASSNYEILEQSISSSQMNCVLMLSERGILIFLCSVNVLILIETWLQNDVCKNFFLNCWDSRVVTRVSCWYSCLCCFMKWPLFVTWWTAWLWMSWLVDLIFLLCQEMANYQK